jgi:hypothetical protein
VRWTGEWCTTNHVDDALDGLTELGTEQARDLVLLSDEEVKSLGGGLKVIP